MASWLKAVVDSKGRRSLRFAPQMVLLEDRTVPATFYVDPMLAVAGDGDTVEFNAGNVNATPGLVFASSFAFWIANQATVNAFSDLAVALAVAEANPGPDEIILASGVIPLDNSGVLTVPDGDINSIPITEELTIRGQGKGASVILPLNNTQIDFNDGNGFVDDEFTPLFHVSGPDANLIADGFSLSGNGKLVGVGFTIRDGAIAEFNNVGINGIIFEPNMVSSGASIVAVDAQVKVNNSEISNYGRNGILSFSSTVIVTNSAITGRGAGMFANNGIEAADGSVLIVTGSTITNNNGTVNPTDKSSGIILLQGDNGGGPGSGAPSESWLVGNTISGNTLGVTLGVEVLDDSKLLSRYNNIVGNEIGVFADFANIAVQADKSWWGDVSGPFNAASNPTGLGNPVTDNVVFMPMGSGSASVVELARQHVNPVVASLDLSSFAAMAKSYVEQISIINTNVNPVGAVLLNANPGTFEFNITFSKPVVGFTVDNINVVPMGFGGAPVLSLVGAGATYTLSITGLTGSGSVSVNVLPRAADDAVDGFLTAASNTATITVSIPNVAPTLTAIADQTPASGAAVGPLAFTVADDADPSFVTLTATSSNAALVPPGSILFGGVGANRTVSFTTVNGVFGTSVITITGTDANGAIGTTSFAVTVLEPVVPPPAPNTAPTISPVMDVNVQVGTAVPQISFTVGDAETPAGNLTVVATSSNPGLVPVAGITLGGAGANRTATIVPVPGGTGTAVITLTVTDADGLSSSTSFAVVVSPVPVLPPVPNTAPTITAVPDVTVQANQGVPQISFTVGDAETPADNLTVVATSSNPGLVPVSGITLGGAGANRTATIVPVPGGTGTAVITLTVTDADGLSSSTSFAVTVNPVVPPPERVRLFAVGSEAGGLPEVAVFGQNGKARFTFLAYESSFTGGVTVTSGDVDGDGVDDIITGTGVGGGARIRVFSGVDGSELANFFAYDTEFRGGVNVAAADLDGDGQVEIVTGAGFGGGPHVKAFKIVNGQPVQILNFFGLESDFRGGVNVAAGQVAGDIQIVVGAGMGGGPRVAQFNIANNNGVFSATNAGSFLAGPATFTGGVFVTVGSFGGNVGNSIATSLGATSAPVVTFRSNNSTLNVYEPAVVSGVRIGAKDVTGDGVDELLVAPGIGGGARIQAFTAAGTQVLNFFAFNNADRDGYFVG